MIWPPIARYPLIFEDSRSNVSNKAWMNCQLALTGRVLTAISGLAVSGYPAL